MQNIAEAPTVRIMEEGDLQSITEMLYYCYEPWRGWKFHDFAKQKETWTKTMTNAIRNFSKSGDGVGIVIQDKGVIMGSAWYLILTEDSKRIPCPRETPVGKATKAEKAIMFSSKFKHELLAKYGKVLCKRF